MVIVYFPEENTKRLNYICRHIFENILGTTFEIVTKKESFLQKRGVCINYSDEMLDRGLQIIPQGLLSENGVRKISDLGESKWNDFFCFFKQKEGDIPFDLFSAGFYLLTSYEEYFSKQVDEHGRFDINSSLLHRNDSLEIPLIDRWAYSLKEELEKKYPDFKCRLRKYRFISTFDIDYPFLYLYKGVVKTLGAAFHDIMKLNLKSFRERLGVIFYSNPDPYMQAIKEIDDFHKTEGRAYYLFVLQGRMGKYGISTVKPTLSYNDYLKSLEQVTIGSHPSYDTFLHPNLLIKEKKELETLLDKEVSIERRHFLRMTCPQSFREAIQAGFKEDFTLGFAKATGFRSGTAIPYYFYDVEKDTLSDLLIHPTIAMDATLIKHLDYSPGFALLKLKQLADECKKSGGDFLCLWHNCNLAGEEKKLWKDVFIASFHYAVSLENNNFAE